MHPLVQRGGAMSDCACHHSAAPDAPCSSHKHALPFGRYPAPTLEAIAHIRDAARTGRITPYDLFELGHEFITFAELKMGEKK